MPAHPQLVSFSAMLRLFDDDNIGRKATLHFVGRQFGPFVKSERVMDLMAFRKLEQGKI